MLRTELQLFRKGAHLFGKSLGLFQIAEMTSLFHDMKLTILGCFRQFCLPFPVRVIVLPIENEDWVWKGAKKGMVIMSCQFTIVWAWPSKKNQL